MSIKTTKETVIIESILVIFSVTSRSYVDLLLLSRSFDYHSQNKCGQ